MNCNLVREQLPALVYGDASGDEKTRMEKHLEGCAGCRREYRALQHVRRFLGTDAPGNVAVNLPRLYRAVADQTTRKARHWRQAAVLAAGVAAVLALIAFGLRFEIRVEAHQLVLRWGSRPVDNSVAPFLPLPKNPTSSGPVLASQSHSDVNEQLQILSRLIHALAEDQQEQEQRKRLEISQLLARLEAMERQSNSRYVTIEKDIDTLFRLSQKGE